MRFKGREMAHMDLGEAVLKKVVEALKDCAMIEVPPKKEGRALFLQIAPEPTWYRNYLKEQEKAEQAAAKSGEKAKDSAEEPAP